MTDHVFVVPPGWPQPPEGWVPPAGWRPEPSWPAAPAGWQFWQPRPLNGPALNGPALNGPALNGPALNGPALNGPVPNIPVPNIPVPNIPVPNIPVPNIPVPNIPVPIVPVPTVPALNIAPPGIPAQNSLAPTRPALANPALANPALANPGPKNSVSVFGGRRKELEAEVESLQIVVAGTRSENEALRAETARLGGKVEASHAELRRLIGIDPAVLRAESVRMVQQRDALCAEVTALRQQLVEVRETAILQQAGLYQYLHPLEDAVAYKSRLDQIKETVRQMTRAGGAVTATTNWLVNDSAREGTAMVRDFSKLMLRAYNAEADNCVRTVRPHRLAAVTDRLTKVRDTIAKLGTTMQISISADYHRARLAEIRLTADYLGKVEEEKELIRAQRERQREEERAQRDFEREKGRLLKEQAHYRTVLERLRVQGDTVAAAELAGKLGEIADAIHGVEEREANIRAGYVYVISNIGAFGPEMVKIGMTRRLEPNDRIRELGDASVPFRFDTHALIFSADAVGLESRLHQALAERKVNLVNQQREFFYASPAEVRGILAQVAGQHLLEYHEDPEAVEWRASRRDRQEAVIAA
ncbi:DUF4041 domain-containing protein [Actinoplanes sp. NPDC026619]|uniref:DUF4041 domain-containing protein n=1 Tax=Actinoplanes sp. NPDC026619 TaxID=3155798 RepID=UPI0033E0E94A